MDLVYPRCAGIDVHKRTAVATIGWVDEQGQRRRKTWTFGTMTAEIEQLAAWLVEHGVTQVAMESTGVYWRPVFNLLEPHVEVVLANAAHVKAVKLRLEVHHPFTAKVQQRFTAKVHQVRGCADGDLGRRVNDREGVSARQAVGIVTPGRSGRSAMRKLRPVMRRTLARWPRRSRPALARSGSPNSSGHSAGARLLVTTMLPFS